MEKTEQSPLCCLTMVPSPLEVKQEMYFQILAPKSKSEETQLREIKTNSQIKQKKVIRFKLDPAQEQYFQESPSTSNQEETQIEENPDSNSNTICPECGKKFASDKAMFGHMRIHEKKGYKGIKSPSNLKLKLKLKLKQKTETFSDLRWSVTGKRGRKPLISTNSPEFLAASILLDMSRGACESKKRKFDQSEPLDEPHTAQIMLEKKFMCETCNKSFSSHQALGGHRSSHRKENGILVISEMVELQNGEIQRVKVKKGDHVCELCGAGFATGQALGGHKRLHYNKNENRKMVSREMVSGEGLFRSFGLGEAPAGQPAELCLF